MKTLILASLLILTGCSGKDKAKNELRAVLPTEVSTIDPASCYDNVCQPVVMTAYETLYEYEYLKRPYQLRPLLASDMPTMEDNGLRMTIKLKPGIPYHPQAFLPKDRTVKAQDFINAFKRQAFVPTKGQGWWLFDGRIVGLNEWRAKVGSDHAAMLREPVAGLSAPDDLTLVINLTKPFPQLVFALGMNFTAPIPTEAMETLKNDFSQVMVGTGAFTLESFNPDQQAVFVKFPGYRSSTYPTQGDRAANEGGLLKDAGKALPFVERVVMTVMKEQQTSWLNFLSGKLDILTLTKDYYQVALTADGKLSPELEGKKVRVQVAPTLIYYWLSFNMKDPVVGKNLKVRQAIAHAVDAEKFIKLFTSNVGQKANSIYPPGIPGYDPSAKLPYAPDLAKARQLLAEAGYPGGKGMPEVTFDVRGNNTLNRQIAEFIVQEVAQIGIKAKPNTNTFPAFLERSRRGELQFWNGGWVVDYPDAENIIQLLVTPNFPPGPNNTFYSNKKVDALFEKIRYMPESPAKHALMAEVEQEVHRELPWVMLYYTRNYVLSQDRVGNYRYSDIIGNYFKYLRLNAGI